MHLKLTLYQVFIQQDINRKFLNPTTFRRYANTFLLVELKVFVHVNGGTSTIVKRGGFFLTFIEYLRFVSVQV